MIDLERIGNAFYTRESFPPFFIKIEKILFRLGSFFKSIIYSSIHIYSFVDLLCESTSEKDKVFKIKKILSHI